MIIDGGRRGESTLKTGNAATLALHLLDTRQNETAELIEVTGVSNRDDLAAALAQMDGR